MRPSTVVLLARPAARTEKDRFALVTAAVAAAGALLLAAARIAALPPRAVAAERSGLAVYVTQGGMRPGVVTGAVLLTVPALALALQALRVGSRARERRMASLRLAGATPRDVQLVAAAETGAAALLGALLAAPAYLLLWLLLGALPTPGLRLVPAPAPLDLLVWAALVPVAAATGALVGYAVQGRAGVDPLGTSRHVPSRGLGRVNLVVLLAGTALMGGGVVVLLAQPAVGGSAAAPPLVMGFLLLVVFAGAPRLVLRAGRRLQRRGGAEDLLAGRRLETDPGPAGRVAAVLLMCGLVLGLWAVTSGPELVVYLLTRQPPTARETFYINGFGITATAALVAGAVAVLTLLIGSADQLLEAQRPLASLAALGVDEPTLLQVLRRQLSAAVLPAFVVGVLTIVVGGLAGSLALVLFAEGMYVIDAVRLLPRIVGAPVLAALLGGLAISQLIRLTVRLLRPRLRAAIDPENLRVA